MTAAELARAVRSEIESYAPPLTDAETVGTPWGLDRIREELELLRSAVVLPSQRLLHVHKQPEEQVWVVATEGNLAVYFDENRSQYGLGSLHEDGSITDWGVYGDLVGTFMAR